MLVMGGEKLAMLQVAALSILGHMHATSVCSTSPSQILIRLVRFRVQSACVPRSLAPQFLLGLQPDGAWNELQVCIRVLAPVLLDNFALLLAGVSQGIWSWTSINLPARRG
jgi:hypothetical protein